MEIFNVSQSLGRDDHPSFFVDVAPLAADLHCRKSLGEMRCQVKLRFDDDLTRAVNIAVLFAKLPPRETFRKVTPHFCTIFFTRRNWWLQNKGSRRVNVAAVVAAVDWSKMILKRTGPRELRSNGPFPSLSM